MVKKELSEYILDTEIFYISIPELDNKQDHRTVVKNLMLLAEILNFLNS